MSDFLDFDFRSYDLGGSGGLDTSFLDQYSSPGYSFETPDSAVSFDFQMPEFVLQGGGWDQASWLREQPEYRLGTGGSLGMPGTYDALFQPTGQRITGYDPSTGVYFDTTGNPVTPQAGGPTTGPLTAGGQVTQAQDPEAMLRQGAYSQSPYSTGAGYGGVPATGSGQPGGAGTGGGGGWMDMVGGFLKSPLGGLLSSAAVGAAGLGAGRALAGGTPRAPQPTLAPGSPINAAGQNTLAQMFADQAAREAGYQAAQAPGYESIRNQAMTLIPGQLNPVTVENYNDPVQAALRSELMSTLQGGASPLVEERLRKEWETLQNTMFRRLGPDWELSSAGQETLQAFNRNANIARDESKRGAVAAYSPLEQERARFSYQAPVEKARALGGEQRAYVDTLSRSSALGRMDPYQLQAGLGGNPDQYRLPMTQLGFQGQTAGFGAQNQERRDIMSGVGSVAGTVAGQIGNLGQSDRIARAIREMNGGALPNTSGGGVLGQRPWGT